MFEDDALPLAAALAYYSLLSMAPLLLVVVSVAGTFFADGQVHMQLIEQMRRLVGEEGACADADRHRAHRQRGAQPVVARDRCAPHVARRQHGVRAIAVRPEPCVACQGVAARSADRELHQAANPVVRARFERRLLVDGVVGDQRRARHAAHLSRRRGSPRPRSFGTGWTCVISFTLATVLIAMMFKYLPDAEIEWRDTWLGVADHGGAVHRRQASSSGFISGRRPWRRRSARRHPS